MAVEILCAKCKEWTQHADWYGRVSHCKWCWFEVLNVE